MRHGFFIGTTDYGFDHDGDGDDFVLDNATVDDVDSAWGGWDDPELFVGDDDTDLFDTSDDTDVVGNELF